MATKINDIVVVNITRETAKITKAGFGTALLMASFSQTEKVLVFGDLEAVESAGFTRGTPVHTAATAYFGQEIKPEKFKVGKRVSNAAKVVKVEIETAVEGNYVVNVNGVDFTYAATTGNTIVQIAAALVSLVNAGTEPVTAAVPGTPDGTFTLTADVAGVEFTSTVSATIMSQTVTTANVNIVTCLSDCASYDPDFYAVGIERGASYDADAKLVMAWISAQRRLGFFCSSDANIKGDSTTDLASWNKSKNYDRSFVFYSGDAASYPEFALLGRNLPEDAGSINWKFTSLQGVVADKLSDQELSNLKAKNCNYYEVVGGLSMLSSDAVMGSGEYVDVMHGIDWLQAQIEENVFGLLNAVKKVPMTNAGISQVVTYMKSALEAGYNRSIINKDYKVTQPDISAVSTADRAARFLQGIKFEATLQGAVNKVKIVGTVSV